MRAESAVEPTRSENMTVTWRRSAALEASARVEDCRLCGGNGATSTPIARQHLSPMAERHPDILEVLIGEVAKHRHIDPVLGKALRVLGHAELFEPVRNLLHCVAALRRTLRRYCTMISDRRSDRELICCTLERVRIALKHLGVRRREHCTPPEDAQSP